MCEYRPLDLMPVPATRTDMFILSGKHILNVQAAIRAPCCKKWFDVRTKP